jgi:Tfp pilus assembly protein PilO
MKVVLAVFVILLTASGFWLTDWQRKIAEKDQLASLCDLKKAEFGRCRAMVSALPQENEKNIRLQRELRAIIQEQLVSEKDSDFVPSAISDIESLVEHGRTRMGDRDFIVLSLAPGALTAAGTRQDNAAGGGVPALKEYPTRTFQMAMTGQYSTVIDFLRQLGALKLKRLVAVNRLSLSPNGEAQQGVSPPLSIQMPITAYLRQGVVQ